MSARAVRNIARAVRSSHVISVCLVEFVVVTRRAPVVAKSKTARFSARATASPRVVDSSPSTPIRARRIHPPLARFRSTSSPTLLPRSPRTSSRCLRLRAPAPPRARLGFACVSATSCTPRTASRAVARSCTPRTVSLSPFEPIASRVVVGVSRRVGPVVERGVGHAERRVASRRRVVASSVARATATASSATSSATSSAISRRLAPLHRVAATIAPQCGTPRRRLGRGTSRVDRRGVAKCRTRRAAVGERGRRRRRSATDATGGIRDVGAIHDVYQHNIHVRPHRKVVSGWLRNPKRL